MKLKRNRLRLEMMRCCLDSKTLAARAGVPVKAVYTALHGGSIRPVTLGKIAKVLCIDPADLFEQEVDT